MKKIFFILLFALCFNYNSQAQIIIKQNQLTVNDFVNLLSNSLKEELDLNKKQYKKIKKLCLKHSKQQEKKFEKLRKRLYKKEEKYNFKKKIKFDKKMRKWLNEPQWQKYIQIY